MANKEEKATVTKAVSTQGGAMSSMVADVASAGAPVIEIEVPGSAVVGGERPAVAGVDDDVKPFPEELIDHEAEAARTTLQMDAKEQYDHDHKLVWIRPRKNLVRTKLGPDWHTFEKGKEYQVAQWKADWLMEKGYL